VTDPHILARGSLAADGTGPVDRSGDDGPRDEPMIEMTRERFEELVSDALDTVPPELTQLIDNCVVLVEDDAPADDPELLGLYDGTPLTERDSHYTMAMPDRITIFRNPTLAMCESEEEVVEEVGITVVHEIAHHFGIDDDRLHELGYA
jgi:predicted Zn-dependent protease with MMP-like domain